MCEICEQNYKNNPNKPEHLESHILPAGKELVMYGLQPFMRNPEPPVSFMKLNDLHEELVSRGFAVAMDNEKVRIYALGFRRINVLYKGDEVGTVQTESGYPFSEARSDSGKLDMKAILKEVDEYDELRQHSSIYATFRLFLQRREFGMVIHLIDHFMQNETNIGILKTLQLTIGNYKTMPELTEKVEEYLAFYKAKYEDRVKQDKKKKKS